MCAILSPDAWNPNFVFVGPEHAPSRLLDLSQGLHVRLQQRLHGRGADRNLRGIEALQFRRPDVPIR